MLIPNRPPQNMTNSNNYHSIPYFEQIDYSVLNLKNTYYSQDCYSPVHNNDTEYFFEDSVDRNYQMGVENSMPERMYQSKDEMFFDKTIYAQDLVLDFNPVGPFNADARKKSSMKFTIIIEIDEAFYTNEANTYQNTAIEEEKAVSCSIEDNSISSFPDTSLSSPQNPLSPETESNWRMTITEFAEKQPMEERQYLMRMAPYIMSSLQEAFNINPQRPQFNKEMFETILKELIYGKEIMLGIENKASHKLVAGDMERLRDEKAYDTPESRKSAKGKRKEKKSVKGHRNHSHMNHMNENYVSNVFRFARTNYPKDEELNQMTSERGVSAMTFRNMTTVKLNDDILMRKAKVRVVASGQELMNNIENWMESGYFESCTDKEKYIQYKERAITNLALDRQY